MKNKMKIKALCVVIFLCPIFFVGADESIKVFSCEIGSHQTPILPLVDANSNQDFFELHLYKIKEPLGEIKLADLDKIHHASRGYDGQDSPVMGAGVDLIFKIYKNDDQIGWYYIFYENHENNPEMLQGRRFKIIKLQNIGFDDFPLFIIDLDGGGQSYDNHLLKAIGELIPQPSHGTD